MQHNCSYKDNEMIFCEYEKGDAFYFIKSGKVKLVRRVKGDEVILDILKAGDIFGEMSIIEPELRSATAISYESTELIKFSRGNFEQVILENPTLSLKLIKTFVRRIWTQQKRLQIYRYKDTESRIVALLLHLKTSSEESKDASPKVYVSQEEIANWTGLSIFECKKQLQSLVSSKAISFRENCITINDLSVLERIVSVSAYNKTK